MKKKLSTIMTASLLGIVAAPVFANVGDTATYKFDLPATSSFSSGYPIVAELKITETGPGIVTFELTPNWTSSGFHSQSIVNELDFVYKGPVLSSGNFSQPVTHGADIKTYSYESNPNNMDSGYKSDNQHIMIDWYTKNDAGRFDNTHTNSIWTISGTGVDITDFTGTKATTPSGKSEPIFGIISVDPYSLKDPHPSSTSNWVSAVPEPETYGMLLVGLGLIGFTLRNKKAQHNQ